MFSNSRCLHSPIFAGNLSTGGGKSPFDADLLRHVRFRCARYLHGQRLANVSGDTIHIFTISECKSKNNMAKSTKMEEEKYMRRCIELAKNGLCNVSPNPMVGAVIVCDGRIIGEGYHIRCGEAHAEVNAIRSVKDESLLKRSTIYVSLEPCSHYGKTPPCADNNAWYLLL